MIKTTTIYRDVNGALTAKLLDDIADTMDRFSDAGLTEIRRGYALGDSRDFRVSAKIEVEVEE